MPPRTRKTARKHTRPIGVPRHQLAPREQDSSSGSNDPIGDLEARVNQLQAELQRMTNLWVADGDRINELRSYIRTLQDQLADRVNKLHAFTDTDGFKMLDVTDQFVLHEQLNHMNIYLSILVRRLDKLLGEY